MFTWSLVYQDAIYGWKQWRKTCGQIRDRWGNPLHLKSLNQPRGSSSPGLYKSHPACFQRIMLHDGQNFLDFVQRLGWFSGQNLSPGRTPTWSPSRTHNSIWDPYRTYLG